MPITVYLYVGIFWVLLQSNVAEVKELKIGIILPYKGRQPWILPKTLPAIEFAVSTIKNSSLLDGYDIIINHNDSKCSDVYGPLSAFHMYSTQTAHVFIGPCCDYSVAPIARFSIEWGIPLISAGALVKAFQDKREYPLLTRVMGSYVKFGVALLKLCQQFGWRHIGLIYSDLGETSKGKSRSYFIMEPIYAAVRHGYGYDPWYMAFDEEEDPGRVGFHVRSILEAARAKARILVVATKPKFLKLLMSIAHQLGMTGGDYVFIVIDLFLSKQELLQPWIPKEDKWDVSLEEENVTAKAMFDCVLLMTQSRPEVTATYMQFSREVKQRTEELYPELANDGEDEVSNFVLSFHDSVLLFAQALNETLESGGTVTDGREITRRMWNRTIAGIQGTISIDSNGDREADYSLYDLNTSEDVFKRVSVYEGVGHNFRQVDGRTIHWPGGRMTQPTDVPKCGFTGERCPPQEPFPISVVITIFLATMLVVVLTATFFVYRHYKLEAELAEMNWRIRYEDILFASPERGKRGEHKNTGKDNRRGSIPSTASLDSVGVFNSKRSVQLFTKTAYVKGAIVALKPIRKSNLTVNKPILLEIKKMKDLQNEHIVRFIGVCIDVPHACILTEYCPKGSLQDVLENEEINLDWMFRYSIMQDIVRGMSHLHGCEIRSHGNLKSSNCVVDSRFVVKITDFGLPYFRQNDDDLMDDSYAFYRSQLWTAPELLRTPSRPPEGTQKGDVYSYAIICQEIVYRNGVFYIQDSDLSPLEICERVRLTSPKGPFRPTLEDYDCPCDDLADVIRRCWSDDPSDRPDFSMLRSVIRKLNKNGDKGNILDNLLTRMEQYANNLEALVAERTSDYLDQKRRAEDLLYSMLPKTVAEQLIRGESVKAVSFDNVTIYFSDIVGFTAMSASCSPMDVVTLLNDLYTTFDSILENFDVYKVETIGDAYMVVSGLPVQNGNLHAREIARMSLALLKAVDTFTIRHRPEDKLKLRIGIHSGSVCTGVVGLKMPRYCLFGDTVNTASRMESTGLPLRIHVSQQTKSVLDTFGTFLLEYRGEVEMKGKGCMETYWLNGENNNMALSTTTVSCL